MGHSFIGIMTSSHHYAHPFSCACGEEDLIEQHSLSTGQRVFIVAMSILVAIPTFGVGGILSFYVLSAALKARNVVWIDYTAAHPHYHQRISFFQPAYWGFRIAVPNRSYPPFHSTPTMTTTAHLGGGHVPVGMGHTSLPHHGEIHVPVGRGRKHSSHHGSSHVPVGTGTATRIRNTTVPSTGHTGTIFTAEPHVPVGGRGRKPSSHSSSSHVKVGSGSSGKFGHSSHSMGFAVSPHQGSARSQHSMLSGGLGGSARSGSFSVMNHGGHRGGTGMTGSHTTPGSRFNGRR